MCTERLIYYLLLCTVFYGFSLTIAVFCSRHRNAANLDRASSDGSVRIDQLTNGSVSIDQLTLLTLLNIEPLPAINLSRTDYTEIFGSLFCGFLSVTGFCFSRLSRKLETPFISNDDMFRPRITTFQESYKIKNKVCDMTMVSL